MLSCLQKNRINRNKLDNEAKSNNKNLDFMPFIQNNINGHIEWEQSKNIFAVKPLKIQYRNGLRKQKALLILKMRKSRFKREF